MTEREALEEIKKLLYEIQVEQAGPSFPGRTHKLRNVQIPKLLEIVKEGLGDD